MDPELQDLQRIYRRGLAKHAASLAEARNTLEAEPEGVAALAAVRLLAHGLVGSGATYGYPAISTAAAELEAALPAEVSVHTERLISVLLLIASNHDPRADRVLIIDPDVTGVALVRRRLETPYCEVLAARTAGEALRVLEEADVSLIVLELMLPDMDGRKLLAQLRERPRSAGIPVVVVSPLATQQAECFALGADTFFKKPVDLSTLTAAISSKLRRSAALTRELRRDVLTGLPNRAAFRETFDRTAALAARGKDPLSIAIIDLDAFKSVNDQHGHSTGDEVLRLVTSTIERSLRAEDLLARWGGDEFVALFPRTAQAGATRALEKALATLKQRRLATSAGHELVITFSAGVAEVSPGQTLEEAMAEADRCLYLVKEAGRAAVASTEAAPPPPRASKVLLAEDDEALAALVKLHLRRVGLEVVHFADGAKALEAAHVGDFSLALLDVHMPGLDGFELLLRLRALPGFAGVPIVMVTAVDREANIVKAFDFGADDYLVKPYTLGELVARVRRHLRARPASAPAPIVPAPLKEGSMSGTFASDQLIEFVQMLGHCGKTGLLQVKSDSFSGHVAFRGGRIVGAATARGTAGTEAAQEVLALPQGTFEFGLELLAPADAGLSIATDGMLVESLRRRNESARQQARASFYFEDPKSKAGS